MPQLNQLKGLTRVGYDEVYSLFGQSRTAAVCWDQLETKEIPDLYPDTSEGHWAAAQSFTTLAMGVALR